MCATFGDQRLTYQRLTSIVCKDRHGQTHKRPITVALEAKLLVKFTQLYRD